MLHIAGADRPGVTSTLAQIIAEENATLVTLGQSVLHGYLMLSAIVDIPASSEALRRILFAVNELGLRLEVSAYAPVADSARSSTPALCVTMLGSLGDGRAMSELCRFLAGRGFNILDIRTLSEPRLDGLELLVDLSGSGAPSQAKLSALRGEILALGQTLSVDIAVQLDDVFRRNKRLVCLDVDSTFMQGELIDELAELVGRKAEVAAITERAMQGELDFKTALTERVAVLEGLPLARAVDLAGRIDPTPGAVQFARVLKSLGFRVGLVSGGFDFFVDRLKQRFGLDFAFANELEVIDDKLTGKVEGSIVDPERKAQILRDMTKVYKFRLEQTVAVGDGANDMLMLQTAGLGIAYRAKPKLQEVADMTLNHHVELDSLLFLMGFSARELSLLDVDGLAPSVDRQAS